MAEDGTKVEAGTISMTFSFEMPQVQMKGRNLSEAKDAANNAIVSGVAGGLKLATLQVKPALNEAMGQSVWRWPNQTIRKNSSDVSAPRDIVDTANLRDSMDATSKESSMTVTYTAPYANMVHYGGITKPYGRGGDSFVYPGRPWIPSMFEGKNGIQKFPLMDIIDKNVKKTWVTRYQNQLFAV